MPRTSFVATVVALLPLTSAALAGDFSSPTLAEVRPGGIDGALVICGGGVMPEEVYERFRDLAGGGSARLVVIPTAHERSDTVEPAYWTSFWTRRGYDDITVLNTRSRDLADSEDFVAPLKTATAAWFVGGYQSRLAEAYVDTRVEAELGALLRRGGVIGGNSAGAAIQSRLMIARGNPEPELMQGLDLLPGTVIDQHFKMRNRAPRLLSVVERYPGHVGLGIDECTAIVCRGRSIEVLGNSTVTVCLGPSVRAETAGTAPEPVEDPAGERDETCVTAPAPRPARQFELSAGELADLTALRRAAMARATPVGPHADGTGPGLNQGALLLVGGGELTPEMVEKFVELAGGSDARIVVVPTADDDPVLEDREDVDAFREAGAGTVTVVHTTDRTVAGSDEFVEPLRNATAVWFDGGRPWRLLDAYEGTAAYEAFRDVLRRGGVIGGSAAGATIQGEYLVRANPLRSPNLMSEGYERGFGFLPGVAIDREIAEHERPDDGDEQPGGFPQLLAIAVAESTAVMVQGQTATILGQRRAVFCDRSRARDDSDEPADTPVAAGESYDLRLRRRIGD
jgi:cyanophycinase